MVIMLFKNYARAGVWISPKNLEITLRIPIVQVDEIKEAFIQTQHHTDTKTIKSWVFIFSSLDDKKKKIINVL